MQLTSQHGCSTAGLVRAQVAGWPFLAPAFRRQRGRVGQRSHGFFGVGNLENADHFAIAATRTAIGIVDVDMPAAQHVAHVSQRSWMVAQIDQEHFGFRVRNSEFFSVPESCQPDHR